MFVENSDCSLKYEKIETKQIGIYIIYRKIFKEFGFFPKINHELMITFFFTKVVQVINFLFIYTALIYLLDK